MNPRDRGRASEFVAMRRRADRRAKLVAHLAFLRDSDTDVDDLFDCIEAGITAAPSAIAGAWR